MRRARDAHRAVGLLPDAVAAAARAALGEPAIRSHEPGLCCGLAVLACELRPAARDTR